MTAAQALNEAGLRGVDRLDAQLLLCGLLGRTRTWLLAHDDVLLSQAQSLEFAANLRRRATGEPLAYLLGQKEFHGLLLAVNPLVLVPRPETEGLVDWGVALLQGELASIARPRVLDLGTGSGAIALAVKRACPPAQLTAHDISADAVTVAAANARRHALQVEFCIGDWWAGLEGRRFDLVLSNPPYIRPDDPHLAALVHEPLLALSPGGDGLAALRTIIEGAVQHLDPGGALVLEHGHDQAAAVRQLLTKHGIGQVQTRLDLAGLPRCTGGRVSA